MSVEEARVQNRAAAYLFLESKQRSWVQKLTLPFAGGTRQRDMLVPPCSAALELFEPRAAVHFFNTACRKHAALAASIAACRALRRPWP
eukprot:351971-Chlamydomonas_euryale.AAC.4